MDEVTRNAFLDEMGKIASKVETAKGVIGKVKDFYAKHPEGVKRTGAIGGIVGGTLVAKRGVEDWSLGRQVRKQQERAMAARG
jgi:hypothetical protein